MTSFVKNSASNEVAMRSLVTQSRSQKGLSLIELVLSITITAAVIGITTPMLISSANILHFISARSQAMQKSRIAVLRLQKELRQVASSDSILTATARELTYYRSGGKLTTIRLENGILKLNDQPLLRKVEAFSFTYFDSEKAPLTVPVSSPQAIREIHYSLIFSVNGHEIQLANSVKPRNF